MDFVREQILIYRLLIADIERRHPEMVNSTDPGTAANAVELQHLQTYRSSLKALESFTAEENPASTDDPVTPAAKEHC